MNSVPGGPSYKTPWQEAATMVILCFQTSVLYVLLTFSAGGLSTGETGDSFDRKSKKENGIRA